MPDLRKIHNLTQALAEKRKATARPQAERSWYCIRNEGARAEVWIYDLIGDDGWGGGIAASTFAQELASISAPEIIVHLNSEGGSVFEGLAIYETLKQHPAAILMRVDALAASAASFIMMAGDRIEMARNARVMIHDAAVGYVAAAGNAKDLRAFAEEVISTADLLDDLSNNIADIYAERAGGDVEGWRERMSAETWFSAAQAIEAGLADAIIGEATPAETVAEDTPENFLEFAALIRKAWA